DDRPGAGGTAVPAGLRGHPG
ncbi:MAG: hypothetical protein AVDCRST_MAG70-740, partial [uncultured Thermomicrobiales bacterium]